MKKKKKKFGFFKLSAIVVFFILLAALFTGFMDINEKKKVLLDLQKQVKQKQAQNSDLKAVLSADDKEIIEKYAREKLGYGTPGERVYIDISGK